MQIFNKKINCFYVYNCPVDLFYKLLDSSMEPILSFDFDNRYKEGYYFSFIVISRAGYQELTVIFT